MRDVYSFFDTNPQSLHELRSFLSMVSYYGKFLPDLSKALAQMYNLLCNDMKWKWSEEQKTAFKDFKELLHSAKLLVYFDHDKEIIPSCDTSPYGVGAVLLHEDDKKKPTGFASKTLVAAEKGYSQLDKEGLAIVFAVTCFHEYLYGQPFTVVTNHKPLMSLFSETKCIPPLASATKRR